ncbi:MAG: GNAT family N-acetyltransferase [Prolixibacteraceae bacterium]|jgi:hypothetical protein|nr:GNAT family N-acetyltransferase [Prolixibacteraceae bacterium]
MGNYGFETFSVDNVNSDEFSLFANKNIFTTIPWIRFIAEDNRAKPIIIRITKVGTFIGYFSGLLLNKYGIKIFGSPFKGWSTCFMGFDLLDNHEIPDILSEIINYIFSSTKCHYIEIAERAITINDVPGMAFKTRVMHTLELEIGNKSEEEIFKEFKGDCRTFIKQFEQRGAQIEVATPDDIFAQEYHDQLIDVFNKQGLVPTYSLNKVKILLKNLKESGMLLCLRVREPNGQSIASSIFIGHKKKCFFWGAASYQRFQAYRPNEYMIWFAIKYWKNLGIDTFDMVGFRDYKLKFGSQKKEYTKIIAAKNPLLIYLRDLAEKVFFNLLKIRGSKKIEKTIRNGNLTINKIINQEIAHYCDNQLRIFSRFNKITIQKNNSKDIIIKLPVTITQNLLGINRLARRLLRLDKSCVLQTYNGYIAFWQNNVYHISNDSDYPLLTLTMTGCRNPLHNSIANVDGRNLYFGEYGQPHPDGKSIYHSQDGGLTWKKVYNISCDKIRHIHSCKWDPYEEKIWVFTGDFEGQSYVLCADPDFKEIEWIGDGRQNYRAVDAVFEKDAVHWIMDSPLSEVHHIRLDRKTRKISIGQAFPGPVWYLKKLDDGIVLAGSVQEIGPSHKDQKVHLFATRNLKKWVDIAQFEHDGYKKGIMKFGVASFAEGNQSSDLFYIHFEAVKKFDGKVIECSLKGI